MTNGIYQLYGWRLSYFTMKLKCYLTCKQIPFEEKPMNAFDLYYMANKKVGVSVMPILVTPKGDWLQDTKDIIDEMEKRYPEHSIYPKTPCKKFVSLVLESWADEYWIPHAMHYRWNRKESVDFFEKEASRNLFPFFPKFIQNYGSGMVMKTLIGYLPSVGVRPNQYPIVEDWTVDMLEKLNDHFAAHPFLLGGTPSIGDIGLAGPLVAHLGRDTWPKENLISKYPHVKEWIDRIQNTSLKDLPPTLETDDIPTTLMPILNVISKEFIPMLSSSVPPIEKVANDPKFSSGRPLPRTLDDVTFTMFGQPFSRRATPFHLWKVQNIIDVYQNDTNENKATLDAWLQKVDGQFNGKDLLQLKFPRLDRVGVRVKVHR